MRRTTTWAVALLAVPWAVLAAPASGQIQLAVEGIYGWADGPARTRVIGPGVELRLPLGLSATAELAHWESAPGGGCVQSFPGSVRCDMDGWLGLVGGRYRLPFLLPLKPYVAGMAGRYLDPLVQGADDPPSVVGAEGGLTLGTGRARISIAYRYTWLDDPRYEELFDDSPTYRTLLFRLAVGL